MRSLTIAPGLLLCGAVAGFAASPALAAEPLGRESRATDVTAVDGHVFWSSYDASIDAYRLIVHANGVSRQAPVAPRSVPFDVDAGRTTEGVTAVYSRCRSESGTPGTVNPDWTAGRGCRLYRWDVAADREHNLAVRGLARGSRTVPSIWGQRLVFAHSRVSGRGLRRYERVRLYATRLGARRPQRLRAGTPGGPSRPFPTRLDLRGSRLTFAWDGITAGLCEPAQPKTGGARAAEVWLAGLGGERRLVERSCETESRFGLVRSPSLGSSQVVYKASGEEGNVFRVAASSLRSSSPASLPTPAQAISVAQDGSRLVYVRAEGERYIIETAARP